MAVNTKLSLALNGKVFDNVDKGTREANLAASVAISLANGVGAGQADRLWIDDFTIAASGTLDVDLAGALLDALGGPFLIARVKALVVTTADLNVNNVVVGAAATNPWVGLLGATHTVTLRPGAFLAAGAGQADAVAYPVIANTGDILRLTNGAAGSAVQGSIAIVGCSA